MSKGICPQNIYSGMLNAATYDRGMDKRGELSAPKTLAIDEKSYGNG